MRENEVLAKLSDLFATDDPGVLVGSGPDDCAHLRTDGDRIAVSSDAFTENSHFLPDAKPEDVAYKSLAASVSDLAASACRPRWATVSLCLRKGLSSDWAATFSRGLAEAARRCGVAIVGGDLVASPAATFVSVTVIGEPLPGGPVLRSTGVPGHVLAVTGNLGGSILGRHLRPEARIGEMKELMRFCAGLGGDAFPSAAMDISDGLSLDLARLCRESSVGAEIEEGLIPVSRDAYALSEQTGRAPLDHALSDGEDFELLVALPERVWERFDAEANGGGGLACFTRIGRLTVEPGVRLVRVDGVMYPLAEEGYQHQW